MYQEYVLIVTHLGANVSVLADALTTHPEIYCNSQPLKYSHPTDLQILGTLGGAQRTCIDTVFFNQHVTNRQLFKVCRFVYHLGHPAFTIHSLQDKYGYAPEESLSYYRFRLQRMVFLARQTKDAMLLTWDQEPAEQEQRLTDFLSVLNPVQHIPMSNYPKLEPSQLFEKAEMVYAKYCEKIKQAITSHRHRLTV